MELRSRSRSKTPGLLSHSESNVGNHVEVITRTTRSSARVVEKFSERKTQLSKSTMKSRHERGKLITSDYSSDDEVSSTKHVTENARNQFKEEYHNSNGNGEFSALKVYKEAGEYWNKFPKTDYTYSEHSKDRIEIAPGVIAMPNMSRKSLLHIYPSSEHTGMHKETNTDAFLSEEVNECINYSNCSSLKPRTLFLNNNHDETTMYTSRKQSTTIISRVYTFFITVFTTMFSWVGTVYEKQNSWVLWIGHKAYKFVSKVMLFDTWTMQGRNNKTSSLVKLCLIPLLFFAGWYALSWLSGGLLGTANNNTQAMQEIPVTEEYINTNLGKNEGPHYVGGAENTHKVEGKPPVYAPEPIIQEKIVKITERITLEPPRAEEIIKMLSKEQLAQIAHLISNKQLQYIASILSKEQLEQIAALINVDQNIIVEQLLQSPVFTNVINKYTILIKETQEVKLKVADVAAVDNKLFIEQQSIINTLKMEIEKIQQDLASLKQGNQANIGEFDAKLTKLKAYFDDVIKSNGRLLVDEISAKLRNEFNSEIRIIEEKRQAQGAVTLGESSISDAQITKIVNEALLKYDADKTGLVDYALEPSGGQILSTRCTENYIGGSAVVSIFGIPLWNTYLNTPRAVITPGIVPGECWAFQNFPGFLVIKLSGPVKIEAFSYEHVSQLLVPNGKIDSAPKEFHVYGLQTEEDKNPILIGKYFFEYNGGSLQFFPAQNAGLTFSIIELQILSNHGNPNYTCMYRFRVHGSLSASTR